MSAPHPLCWARHFIWRLSGTCIARDVPTLELILACGATEQCFQQRASSLTTPCAQCLVDNVGHSERCIGSLGVFPCLEKKREMEWHATRGLKDWHFSCPGHSTCIAITTEPVIRYRAWLGIPLFNAIASFQKVHLFHKILSLAVFMPVGYAMSKFRWCPTSEMLF